MGVGPAVMSLPGRVIEDRCNDVKYYYHDDNNNNIVDSTDLITFYEDVFILSEGKYVSTIQSLSVESFLASKINFLDRINMPNFNNQSIFDFIQYLNSMDSMQNNCLEQGLFNFLK